MNRDEIKLAREMKRIALDTARMDDWDDPWGTAMTHFFGVAEVLYHARAEIPRRWQFRHPSGDSCSPITAFLAHSEHGEEDPCDCRGQWPDVEYVPFLDAGPLGVAMLTYAGDVLNRYLGFVKRAGRDY